MSEAINRVRRKNARLMAQKAAIRNLLSTEDGKLLLQYLADITMADAGVPLKDLGEYAFKQGQRSVLITLIQFCEKRASDFCLDKIYDMVRFDEGMTI